MTHTISLEWPSRLIIYPGLARPLIEFVPLLDDAWLAMRLPLQKVSDPVEKRHHHLQGLLMAVMAFPAPPMFRDVCHCLLLYQAMALLGSYQDGTATEPCLVKASPAHDVLLRVVCTKIMDLGNLLIEGRIHTPDYNDIQSRIGRRGHGGA